MRLKLFQRYRLVILTAFVLAFTITLALVYTQSLKFSDENFKKVFDNNVFLTNKLASFKHQFEELKNQDQYKINKQLDAEIKSIQSAYQKSVVSYEKLLDLKVKNVKTAKMEESFAEVLKLLSEKNYASVEGALKDLDKQVQDENDKLVSNFKIPENLPSENTPPGSGYRRQQVQTDIWTFMVDIVSADLGSTRVIVDTASDSDCSDNCPVLSLGDYVSRNGAFAGVNGSYFCPSTYPSCAGKKNSFDTLLMNKNKKYFNSDNNVYSTVPAAIFQGGSVRFVGRSLEWGRDTGIDSMIANYPLLTSGNRIVYGGDGDLKHGSKGGRSFVGASGGTVYIGVVYNATLAESAKVLNTLGISDALNLDNGGSTALWSGGYKAGPGRNIPNAILFVRK